MLAQTKRSVEMLRMTDTDIDHCKPLLKVTCVYKWGQCLRNGKVISQLAMVWTSLHRFSVSLRFVFSKMSRRSHSPDTFSRPIKRQKTDHLTPEDYKNGVFLAPMVRSGACRYSSSNSRWLDADTLTVPTRLFALKHGATMVWGPEIVDKAMLHAKREVDRVLPNTLR